jgi:two-component system KDP operon response regulator KdpE
LKWFQRPPLARRWTAPRFACLTRRSSISWTKPFASTELLARLEASLRRAAPESAEPKIVVGDLEIDLGARTVFNDTSEIRLTAIEYELLRLLVRDRGKVLTHRHLLTEVWGPAYDADVATLRFHIANLRKKLEPPGRREPLIRTEIGIGYRLVT